MGALLGALFLSSATAVSQPVTPEAPPPPDGSIAVSDKVPEPGYSLLGACISCVLLLHRRRSADLTTVPRTSCEPHRGLRKLSSGPTRAPLLRRKAATGRLIGTLTSGRASLRPLRAR
ncbi:MAG: hypothetical protein CMN02_11780 [Roseibacillus sp.]|nr:hypothetical protein [Roseibacillus sp.]